MLTATAMALVVATTMLAGTTTASVATERASARPAVGECRVLKVDDLADGSNNTPTVQCSAAHTARTFAVVTVGRKISTLSKKEIRKVGEAQCTPKFFHVMGESWRDRIKSAYFFVFYTPTTKQVKDGQNWLRCDLVLAKGRGLANLPNNNTPVIGSKGVNANAKACVSKQYKLTVCAEGHKWNPAGAFAIKRENKPSAWQVSQLAEDHCKNIAGTARFTYVNWLSEWNSGNKMVMCFKR
ncbi:MAG: septum formation family protein [Nocardioides sp.]